MGRPLILSAAIGLFGISGCATPAFPDGSPAPNFSVIPLTGGAPVSLASLRGKPVLVDFGATWCEGCVESFPDIQALYNDFKSKGLQVLVVSNEQATTIQAFIEKNKYTFPVYRDPGNAAENACKIKFIPTTLIIDKDGKLESYFDGSRDESMLRAELKKVGIE